MKYDIVAFGVHPDDLEIGIFGTLAMEIKKGKKVLLVDLTEGEMGSNGTPEIRRVEALSAAKIIGADRICLSLPDRGILVDHEQLSKVIEVIRTYCPKWILYPYEKDYHPDHERGSQLIREAILSSGLAHFKIKNLEPHRPNKTAMYYINDVCEPNLYVDITEGIELKRKALEAHASQFLKSETSKSTYLNDNFIDKIMIRDAYFGTLCKKPYAEAIKLIVPPVSDGLEGVLL